MNRLVITLNTHGEPIDFASDEPIELIFNCPHCDEEPLYHYNSVKVGVQYVREILGDNPIAYGAEKDLIDYNGSKPDIRIIKDE